MRGCGPALPLRPGGPGAYSGVVFGALRPLPARADGRARRFGGCRPAGVTQVGGARARLGGIASGVGGPRRPSCSALEPARGRKPRALSDHQADRATLRRLCLCGGELAAGPSRGHESGGQRARRHSAVCPNLPRGICSRAALSCLLGAGPGRKFQHRLQKCLPADRLSCSPLAANFFRAPGHAGAYGSSATRSAPRSRRGPPAGIYI